MPNKPTFLILAAAVILPTGSLAYRLVPNPNQTRGESEGTKQTKGEALVHARPETVQTKNAKKAIDSGVNPTRSVGEITGQFEQLPTAGSAVGREEQRSFSRSGNGRKYDNGIPLRASLPVRVKGTSVFFPQRRAYYPYCQSSFNQQTSVYSPFSYYFGVSAPYIGRKNIFTSLLSNIHVEIPRYSGLSYVDWHRPSSENYYRYGNLDQEEPGLRNAIGELEETFRAGNIDAMVTLCNPQGRIGVFMEGKYSYSLGSADFLNLTRDAIANIRTVDYTLNLLHMSLRRFGETHLHGCIWSSTRSLCELRPRGSWRDVDPDARWKYA